MAISRSLPGAMGYTRVLGIYRSSSGIAGRVQYRCSLGMIIWVALYVTGGHGKCAIYGVVLHTTHGIVVRFLNITRGILFFLCPSLCACVAMRLMSVPE